MHHSWIGNGHLSNIIFMDPWHGRTERGDASWLRLITATRAAGALYGTPRRRRRSSRGGDVALAFVGLGGTMELVLRRVYISQHHSLGLISSSLHFSHTVSTRYIQQLFITVVLINNKQFQHV